MKTIRVIRRYVPYGDKEQYFYWIFGDVWSLLIEEAQIFHREDTADFCALGLRTKYGYHCIVVEIELRFE